MSSPALSVRVDEVSHSYAGSQAEVLRSLSLQVPPGGRVCIVGESGAGKSTLLNILGGLLRPGRGSVQIGNTKLSELSERKCDAFRARHIGFVFQTFQLLPGLSALENLELAQYFAGQRDAEASARARDLLKTLGLADKLAAKSQRLSVGERQRVAIARAVCKQPGLILADEPTASLDDASAADSLSLLLEQSKHATLVVVTHDLRIVDRFEQVVRLPRLSLTRTTAQPSSDGG